jgi:hypothetical protein
VLIPFIDLTESQTPFRPPSGIQEPSTDEIQPRVRRYEPNVFRVTLTSIRPMNVKSQHPLQLRNLPLTRAKYVSNSLTIAKSACPVPTSVMMPASASYLYTCPGSYQQHVLSMNPGCRYGGEAFFGTATQEPSIAPNVNVSCGAMPRVPQAG